MRNIPLAEQEVVITISRDSDTASVYCSDSTWITKMDKLVSKSPELFKVVRDDDFGKTYSCPKRLVSMRSSIKSREMTDEQRQAAADRLRAARAIRGNE